MKRLISALAIVLGACGGARADGISDGQKCAATTGNPDLAIHYCVRAIYSGDFTQDQLAATFYNRGLEYKRKGDYDQAIKDFDAAIKLRPNFARAFNSRGVAYFDIGVDELAIRDFDAAIQMMPGDAGLRRNRAMVRFYRGEFAAAVPDMQAAVQLNPSDARDALWLYLAQARAGLGGAETLSRFAANRDLNEWPGPVIAMFLGIVGAQAVADIGRAAAERGQPQRQCEAYFYVGQYQLMRGVPDNAAEFFRAAAASDAVGVREYIGARAELARLSE